MSRAPIYRRPFQMARFLAGLTLAATVAVTAPGAAEDDEGGLSGNWWSNNSGTLDAAFQVDRAGGDNRFWWPRRLGPTGGSYRFDTLETNPAQGPDYLSVDFKRRLFTATHNNYVALGLGWGAFELGDGSDTQGPRVLLEGQLGLTPMLSLYGHTAWLPKLEETRDFEDPDGFEIEAGFALDPVPHLSFRAGYREFRLDFTSLRGANDSSSTKGVVFGAGVHW